MVQPRIVVGACVLACVLALFTGCREPEGGLHVVVSGSLTPGADFDRLSVIAYLASDRTPLHDEVVESDALKLPLSVNLVSGPGTPVGTEIEVLASAELHGTVVSAVRGRGALEPKEGGVLELRLPDVPPASTQETIELCDDGVDDDGDGLADCADPDCEAKSCLAGGLICANARCGCGQDQPVGAWTEPASGFLGREDAVVYPITQGPRAGWLAIAGGIDADGKPSATVELYQPSLVRVEEVTLQSARRDPTLTVMAGGALYALGGRDGSGKELASFERLSFDPMNADEQEQPLSRGFSGAEVIARSDDLLLVGGSLGRDVLRFSSSEVSSFARLSEPRQHGMALADGRIWFASGPEGVGRTTELLAADGSVTSGPLLPQAISDAALVSLPRGRALLVGGPSAFIASAQGDTVSLREIEHPPVSLSSPRAVVLANGWVYVEDAQSGAAAWFDPAAERWVLSDSDDFFSQGSALAATAQGVFHLEGLSGAASMLHLQCSP